MSRKDVLMGVVLCREMGSLLVIILLLRIRNALLMLVRSLMVLADDTTSVCFSMAPAVNNMVLDLRSSIIMMKVQVKMIFVAKVWTGIRSFFQCFSPFCKRDQSLLFKVRHHRGVGNFVVMLGKSLFFYCGMDCDMCQVMV